MLAISFKHESNGALREDLDKDLGFVGIRFFQGLELLWERRLAATSMD